MNGVDPVCRDGMVTVYGLAFCSIGSRAAARSTHERPGRARRRKPRAHLRLTSESEKTLARVLAIFGERRVRGEHVAGMQMKF